MSAVILTTGPQLAFWLLCAAMAGGIVAVMVCAMCAAAGTEDMANEHHRRLEAAHADRLAAEREHAEALAALAYEQGRAAELERLYAALRLANESPATYTPADAHEALQRPEPCPSFLNVVDEFGRPVAVHCAQPAGHRGWTDHPHTAERDGHERHLLYRWTDDEAAESVRVFSSRLEHTDYVLSMEAAEHKAPMLQRLAVTRPGVELFAGTVHSHVPLDGKDSMGVLDSPCSMACRSLTSVEADELEAYATSMPELEPAR